ncbi:transcriptional regulator [Terrihabitans soli]|uniref:Transcriptional regulator n=1 Tax=Terrihabitans soli TaxID=708113 RepID=A0A6S6QPJ8_9HYPH|nr:GntR family transcriptional regulator [Terrihabitans soli]BCJ90919.1 transcriptional regulator [Terrihabitans soli]
MNYVRSEQPLDLASAKEERPKTRAELIKEELADAIVRGAIGPGVALDEMGLAKRFGVSRTPIREAIRQLEAIGFAEARPRRGAVVAHITQARLNEMFAVMAELEAMCSSFSALKMPAEEKAALRSLHEQCAEFAEAGKLEGYMDLNFQFHEAIYRGTHNSYLTELTLSVRQRLAPFRRAQFSGFDRLKLSVVEHGRVVEAIERGDADGAAEAMRQHLQIVRDSVDEVKG